MTGRCWIPDRALKLAAAAGGALEGCLHREVFCWWIVGRFFRSFDQQRRIGACAKLVQVSAQAEDDLFGIEYLSGRRCRTVFGAASALYTAISLQRDELRDIFPRHQSKVLISGQWRNLREAIALQENSQRAQHQMQVFGMRNQWQEDEQSQRVCPPKRLDRDRAFCGKERAKVGHHQQEYEGRDEARLIRDLLAQPDRTYEKSTHEEGSDRHGDQDCPKSGETKVEPSDDAPRRQKTQSHSNSEVVQRDQRKGQESPEDEGMGDPRSRPLFDHLSLAKDLPEELPYASAKRMQAEILILLGPQNCSQDWPEAPEKKPS